MIYKDGLPEDRFLTVRGLYQAPEPSAIARSFEDEDERRGGIRAGAKIDHIAPLPRRDVAE